MRLFEGTAWDRPPHCERCEKPESECTCPPLVPEVTYKPPEKQTARLAVEKRQKGKFVTVIRGLRAADNDLPALLKQIKNSCGTGGTINEDELEIQGDQLERLREILKKIGYRC